MLTLIDVKGSVGWIFTFDKDWGSTDLNQDILITKNLNVDADADAASGGCRG